MHSGEAHVRAGGAPRRRAEPLPWSHSRGAAAPLCRRGAPEHAGHPPCSAPGPSPAPARATWTLCLLPLLCGPWGFWRYSWLPLSSTGVCQWLQLVLGELAEAVEKHAGDAGLAGSGAECRFKNRCDHSSIEPRQPGAPLSTPQQAPQQPRHLGFFRPPRAPAPAQRACLIAPGGPRFDRALTPHPRKKPNPQGHPLRPARSPQCWATSGRR